jgi:hypothetical protein
MLGSRSTVYINLLPKVPQYSVPVSASVNNTDVGGGEEGRKEGRKKQRGVFPYDATAAAKASINVDVRCTMYDVTGVMVRLFGKERKLFGTIGTAHKLREVFIHSLFGRTRFDKCHTALRITLRLGSHFYNCSSAVFGFCLFWVFSGCSHPLFAHAMPSIPTI